MNKKVEKREETRAKILEAALQAFSEHGFAAAGTRDIANRAGVNQGLITYHFQSKEVLWRETASKVFSDVKEAVTEDMQRGSPTGSKEVAKSFVKAYVRFVARRPELIRFIVEEGKQPSDRVDWLVDTHLKPLYQNFWLDPLEQESLKPHTFYIMIGAATLMFAVRPVCVRLTGLDPQEEAAIETHAELLANLLVS